MIQTGEKVLTLIALGSCGSDNTEASLSAKQLVTCSNKRALAPATEWQLGGWRRTSVALRSKQTAQAHVSKSNHTRAVHR